MDIHTYLFSKNTLYRETDMINIPEEVRETVHNFKNRGFILYGVENPQTKAFSREIMAGSYVIKFAYDLGEERLQILKLDILKNQWTKWKTEWWLMLDEVKDHWIGKGNDFNELLEKTDEFFNKIKIENKLLNVEKSLKKCRVDGERENFILKKASSNNFNIKLEDFL